MTPPLDTDVLVIGAGFGGLATALTLAEGGARVVLCEGLKYPGGCASTFERQGLRFEAGATLFSGLAPHQLFGRWITRHDLDVEVDWLDPAIELRTPHGVLPIGRRVEGADDPLLAGLLALPGAPEAALRRFFRLQRRAADALWSVLDTPELLPPLSAGSVLRHALRAPRYLPMLRWMGRPLAAVLRAYGLADFAPLRTALDALCQITLQCGVDEVEAPHALAVLDYPHRGTGHVRGGIGRLAWGLADAIRACGGEVRLADRVRGLRREPSASGSPAAAPSERHGGWRVTTRHGEVRARHVVANLLPAAVQGLLDAGGESARPAKLTAAGARVAQGWGACMLYLVARPPAGSDGHPTHLQMVDDASAPFLEGNHVFLSASGSQDGDRCPEGRRTLTVSTHVRQDVLRRLDDAGRAGHVAAVQERMRETLRRRAPEWWAGVETELTASPRTFERFTGRPGGYVGGVPRRAGLSAYRHLGPCEPLPGLHLVGDSVFPGQSTYATALGGVRLAAGLAKRLGSAVR